MKKYNAKSNEIKRESILSWGIVLVVVCLIVFFIYSSSKTKSNSNDDIILSDSDVKKISRFIDESFLLPAWDEFLNEFENDEKYLKCEDKEYDKDQIKIRWFEDYGVIVEYEGIDEYTVFLEVRLKYLDKDNEEKCYKNIRVQVLYREVLKQLVTVRWV